MNKPGTFETGHKPHNTGKKWPIETRLKISRSLTGKTQSVETKHKRSVSAKRAGCGLWMRNRTGEQSNVLGKHWKIKDTSKMKGRVSPRKGIVMKKEQREKVSRGVSLAIQEGRLNAKTGHVHGLFYSSKNKKELFYRSSWEMLAFQMLEKDDSVLKYDVESLRIEYVDSTGIKRNTIPDLYVYFTNNTAALIEIKPDWKLKSDKNTSLKIDAHKKYADEHGIRYEVWSNNKFIK